MLKNKSHKSSIQNQSFVDTAQESLMLETFLFEDRDMNVRDSEERNALYWAIKTSHKPNIDLLLKHGVSLMVKPNYHALFHTIESNNLEAFALLLKECQEINMLNKKGQTPLMKAIQKSYGFGFGLLCKSFSGI